MEMFKKFFITIGIASLLAALFFLGGHMLSQTAPQVQAISPVKTFGEVLWGTRSLDMLIQGVIIFIGAVGVFTLMADLFNEGARVEAKHSTNPEVKQ